MRRAKAVVHEGRSRECFGDCVLAEAPFWRGASKSDSRVGWGLCPTPPSSLFADWRSQSTSAMIGGLGVLGLVASFWFRSQEAVFFFRRCWPEEENRSRFCSKKRRPRCDEARSEQRRGTQRAKCSSPSKRKRRKTKERSTHSPSSTPAIGARQRCRLDQSGRYHNSRGEQPCI